MNTRDLELILRRDRYTRNIFKGVYAINKLPEHVPVYPAAYVINTAPSTAPGEHWVALYFDKEKVADYFDSYGMHPFGIIYDFAADNAFRVRFNTIWLQNPVSLVCGAYCVYFLYFRCRGLSMSEITRRHFVPYAWNRNDAYVRNTVLVLLEDTP